MSTSFRIQLHVAIRIHEHRSLNLRGFVRIRHFIVSTIYRDLLSSFTHVSPYYVSELRGRHVTDQYIKPGLPVPFSVAKTYDNTMLPLAFIASFLTALSLASPAERQTPLCPWNGVPDADDFTLLAVSKSNTNIRKPLAIGSNVSSYSSNYAELGVCITALSLT